MEAGAAVRERPERDGLTPEEQRLRMVLRVLGLAFLALAAGYVAQGLLGPAEFPFVANSTAKDGLFGILCVVAAADLRRFGWAVTAVVAGHALICLGLGIMLAAGRTDSVAGSFGSPAGIGVPSGTVLAWLWLALAAGVAAGLGRLHRTAWRRRFGLRYLGPTSHRSVLALAEVLIQGPAVALTPAEIARNVDDYLYAFTAREKWRLRLALRALAFYPLVRLRPPFGLMSVDQRARLVERWFVRDVVERRLPGFLRRTVQSMMHGAQQLVFIGYYADPRTARRTGYVPFSRRPEAAEVHVDDARPRVRARLPHEIDGPRMETDVVVIGSGAAGAIIAHDLAAAGREVTVLERGPHVDPSEFTEDERVQFSTLFRDGGMQLSADARFQVLQGMCVGGTTVVNNAVCFPTPEHVLERWNDPHGLDAGLDAGEVAAAARELERWLPIRSMTGIRLQPGAAPFEAGVRRLGLDRPPADFRVVDANIAGDCVGCGYCNIGCPFGKKLSMLETALPWAQRDHGLRIVAECRAERIEHRGRTATGVRCRLSDGRRLTVRARTVVVSAGAIASSLLLLRSGIGGRRAGRGLCFNLGAPMTAEFPGKLDAYAGLQITHALQPDPSDGLILETWFNPVGAQALMMPGWFGDHFRNMSRYDHMASAGAVVGTRPAARVRPARLGREMRLDYSPAPDDLARLVEGLKIIGRVFLAGGAQRVMPPTYRFLSFSDPGELDELDRHVRDNTDITLHSSHPQGGNAVSRDPAKGVVDPDFRVHGWRNLHVCDASVFPSAVTVNPQVTVMSLAKIAARRALTAP